MTRTTWTTTTALLIGLLTAQSARADVHAAEGAFDLSTDQGAALGSATIDGGSGELVLTVKLRDGTARPAARRDRTRSGLVFVTGGGSSLAGAVTNAGAATSPMTIELAVDGAGFRVTRKRDGQVVGRERMARIRAALLVHAITYDQSHVNAFKAYATQLARHYRAQGYSAADVIAGVSHEAVIEKLLAAEAAGKPYERLVYIGHGGWDGPILGTYSTEGTHQTSSEEEPATFGRLVDAIKRGTTPAARIFSSSCHAGGSNVYERANGSNKYIWSDDLARQTGRVVAGPAGYTSTEYTQRHVLAVLEGQGTTVQEVRWASRDGTRTIRSGAGLTSVAITRWGPAPAPTPTPTASTTPAATTPPADAPAPAGTPVVAAATTNNGPAIDGPLGD